MINQRRCRCTFNPKSAVGGSFSSYTVWGSASRGYTCCTVPRSNRTPDYRKRREQKRRSFAPKVWHVISCSLCGKRKHERPQRVAVLRRTTCSIISMYGLHARNTTLPCHVCHLVIFWHITNRLSDDAPYVVLCKSASLYLFGDI